jgi:hypothetical protein
LALAKAHRKAPLTSPNGKNNCAGFSQCKTNPSAKSLGQLICDYRKDLVMTKTKPICFLGLAVVAAGLLVLAGSGDKPADLSGSTKFPTTISGNRVELPPKPGEEIRYVYFADDKVTRKLLQVEYRSGVTEFTSYRPDGVAKETRTFFPVKDGAKTRQLRSLVTFQNDGRSYQSHQVYREDGTLERNGGRLVANAYQTLYFNAKDGTVQRRLLFSNLGQLDQEESFSDSGKLIEKTEKVEVGELKTTRWNADGKVVSEIIDKVDGLRSGKLYFDDGKTVKVEFEHRGYEIAVDYFDKNGTLTVSVGHVPQGMTVTVYGSGEQAQYKQYWLLTGGTRLDDATYRLVKIEEFDRWGSERDQHQLKRVIGVAEDGKTPNRAIAPKNQAYSYERTDTDFYPDGSVKNEKEYDSSNNVTVKTFVQGEKPFDGKPELFVKPVFEPLDVPDSKFKTAAPVDGEESTED